MEFKLHDNIRLTKESIACGYQGKALSPNGKIIAIDNGLIRVLRDGIKTTKWYQKKDWEFIEVNSEVEELYLGIQNNIEDFDRYGVYADYLEEHGAPYLGAAWRWMGKQKKRPEYLSKPGLLKRFAWYSPNGTKQYEMDMTTFLWTKEDVPPYSVLPAPLMMGRDEYGKDKYVGFTHDDAVKFLADGLNNLQKILET